MARAGAWLAMGTASLALSACGGARPPLATLPAGERPGPVNGLSPGPVDPTVQFRGGRIAGTLYVVAGPGSETNGRTDVYVIRGAIGSARRLTYSVSEGIDYVAASGADVLVSDGRDGLVGDEVRQLRVAGRSAALSPILGVGELQAAGTGGRFLYGAFQDAGSGYGSGYWREFQARLGHRGRGLVLRTSTTHDGSPVPVAAWGPGGGIAVALGSRVILDAGSPAAHSVPGLKGSDQLVGGGSDGLLAVAAPRKIALLSSDGQLRVYRKSLFPVCFSPSGREVVVINSRFDQLELMSITTGALTPLASVAGHIAGAAWVAR